MPIDFKDGQVVVSCVGDILVLPLSPQPATEGVAWLLLQEREEGEIGRDLKGADDLMCINEQPGVLIGATDPRSIDVIISALTTLRQDLQEHNEFNEPAPLNEK